MSLPQLHCWAPPHVMMVRQEGLGSSPKVHLRPKAGQLEPNVGSVVGHTAEGSVPLSGSLLLVPPDPALPSPAAPPLLPDEVPPVELPVEPTVSELPQPSAKHKTHAKQTRIDDTNRW